MGQMDGIYPKNKKTAKNIAMAILALIFLQTIGVLGAFGFDLTAIDIGGYSILLMLQSIGVLWLLWGLHKQKIGS